MSNQKPDGRLARLLTRLIEPVAPSLALSRDKAMVQRRMLASMGGYQGAGRGSRGKDFRINSSDAVEAIRYDATRMSFIARDMIRNNPRAVKVRRQLRNVVVGAGIRPSIQWLGAEGEAGKKRRAKVEKLIRAHCETKAFDADGLLNLFGQQGLSFGSIVADGEVLLRRRMRKISDGFPLNFQVQVLEADFLDKRVDGRLSNGNTAVQGIEFNRIGQRVAYHLYRAHPGSNQHLMQSSSRVDARNIIHAFAVDRPGQQRGVSWFAPVITLLHELQKYQDGQVKRQEIAAMFAAVFQSSSHSTEIEKDMAELSPGALLEIGSDETMTFTDPPEVDGYEAFMRVTDRVIAAGVGLTYEGYTGDYTGVNYSSARMGRMDTDPNVRDWQQNLMIAQICHGIGGWIEEAIDDIADVSPDEYELSWTPPARPVVDPTKDYPANVTAVQSGQKSRRQAIREAGEDPTRVEAEIAEERQWEAENSIVLTSNSGAKAGASSDKGDKNETG
ncbi:phage portal protein [Ruegeria sp. Ofav3-42]|uniref:phage portal protein n=1 Tax=Ruegeria sp. Ofav3-42 TaxID=2917759 RepID=UPI001EF60B9E|nr:phage portal protein [Ruegeria sp. Ofav3-42]MCG7520854.1 phage portal protein [Ruegeria sp. Ofav3-42]